MLDFGKPTERAPGRDRRGRPRSGISEDGQFPPGSMGPKVRCRDAVPPCRGASVAVISTAAPALADAATPPMPVDGSGAGTRIVAARRAARSRDMTTGVRVFRDTYVDSVVQLVRDPRDERGRRASSGPAAAMATPANLQTLAEEGFATDEPRRGPTICSSRCEAPTTTWSQDALAAGADTHVRRAAAAAAPGRSAGPTGRIGRAARELPGSNVAVVSVPGDVRGARGARGADRGAGRAAVQRQRVRSPTRWR